MSTSVPAAVTDPASPLDPATMRGLALRISQYFRDFLESDFKRAQTPRRRIVLTADNGFRAAMRSAPYPSLDEELWELLSTSSGKALRLPMLPRRHTRVVGDTLRRIIQDQVNAIPETTIVAVQLAVQQQALASIDTAGTDPEAWIEQIRAVLAEQVASEIIRPLLAQLAGPLKQQAYWALDSLHAAESDLVARITADLYPVLLDVLSNLLVSRDPRPLREACENALTLATTRDALLGFLEGFVAADAYSEFRDLETHVAVGVGLQLYLYVGALKFGGQQYPLFFVPVQAERAADGSGYQLTLLSQLYVNRRAVDYVLQELAEMIGREWASPVKERIHYLQPEQSLLDVARPLFEQIANAMDLGGQGMLDATMAERATSNVRLSAELHLAAFERSDEALLNDYEAIIDHSRRGGNELLGLFEHLVDGVLLRNPEPIGQKVEADWAALSLPERLVCDSPIPLNEEQRKVLLALNRPEGKIIVVEGPPGTGKSHTITAIAADCAFNQRSCLVLSDKTEALDVVYDKLSEAMSRVRHDRDFPNPILRLGQQATNFKRLTSNQTLTQVDNYARAMRANRPRLEAERRDTARALKDAIDGTVEALGRVSLASVQAMHVQEAEIRQRAPQLLAQLEAVENADALAELTPLLGELDGLEDYLAGLFAAVDYDTPKLLARVRRDLCVTDIAAHTAREDWACFETLDAAQLRRLGAILLQYQQLRMPLFGYLFRGSAVRALELELNQMPATRPLLLRSDAAVLARVQRSANELRLKLEREQLGEALPDAYRDLAHGSLPADSAVVAQRAMALLHRLNPAIVDALLAHPKDDPGLWPHAIRFLHGWLEARDAFLRAPEFDYVGTKTRLEQLNTSVMNAHVDGRLLDFMDRHRSDARALAGVIAQRQKFPVEKFAAVRESFPVIIASIREFGQYMPLAPDLFDVLVIDEASQVSVAQALPALLRAKKVVVLGDSKQFSNVKSANASIALNDKYRAELLHFFRGHVGEEAAMLERLAMFDVKRSVLEFCSLAASHTIMLRKHFRSYQELIGYCSATFYGHQLQALKVRAVPLAEVIRFSTVSMDGRAAGRTANAAEADFILERLLELLERPNPPSVGVITPFREQQTLLSKRLHGHPRGADFERRLRLKVMTFDSCQGEERQIIFYSMVASPGHDALGYVFPVALDNAQEAVTDKLKAQRLNVGFSRAQETVWFVLSQPLEAFRGAIGKALAHYAGVLARPEVEVVGQTDPRSPMEAKVLHWLQQTAFVQAHGDAVDIIAQFPVGDYLRQLDPTYRHPAWRVDFLVTVRNAGGALQIVIEYDGFEYHFQKGKNVNAGNHERYLVEADVERQLTLESYGYRFLRINRFNLGQDPVQTLSERLYRLLEAAGVEPLAAAVEQALDQAAALASRDMKPCARCGTIREQAQFFDPDLREGAGGHGRVCMPCKAG